MNEATVDFSHYHDKYLFNNICMEDLRGALLAFAKQTQAQAGQALLMELMFRMKRFDILKKVFGTNRQQVEGILKKGAVLSDYRVLMAEVSENLGNKELQSLIFLLSSTLPKERLARATSFLDVVVELEKLDEVSCDKVDLLEQCLRNINRMDLVKRIQAYKNRGQNVPCAVPKVQKSFKFAPVQCQPSVQQVKQTLCFSQEFQNLKVSVPETGTQHRQALMEQYEMNPEQRGLCVIIDCVGFDGEMMNQTFKCLGFKVIFHSLLALKETQKVLEDLTRNRILQGVSCFVCCIISRGTDTHLLATDSSRLGIMLEDLRQLFSPTQCPSLCDAPACHYSRRLCAKTRTIPASTDLLWSVCRAEAKLLEGSGHQSVYLHALNSTFLMGCQRKMLLLDIMEEVTRNVFSYNQQNPENQYHLQLSHTLCKKLYL
uniref:CASP8 and FADD-like apoptosis regulator a n=1 Tax=Cyprinus carpio TaxID=7962 RepID=A0A8C1JHP6_CYPCA